MANVTLAEDDLDRGAFPTFSSYHLITQMVLGDAVLVENLVLLLLIATHPSLHTTSYAFVFSLAVTDLVVGVISGVVGALMLLALPEDSMEIAISCQVLFGLPMVLLSSIHMALIAVERYCYVARPYWYQRHVNARLIAAILSGIWTLALILAIFLFCTQIHRYPTILSAEELNPPTKFGIIANVYVCATSVTCVAYVRILRFAHDKRHVLTSASRHERMRYSLKAIRHARSLKFFISVFVVYLVLTLPYMLYVSFIYDVIGVTMETSCVFLNFVIGASGTNFLVLMTVDRRFRKILWKSCRFPCRIRNGILHFPQTIELD